MTHTPDIMGKAREKFTPQQKILLAMACTIFDEGMVLFQGPQVGCTSREASAVLEELIKRVRNKLEDNKDFLSIAAALAEARAVPQWLPIESAPRDGTWIFAYWPTMSITEYPTVVFADDCSEHDIWYKPNDLDFGCVYPTHWQPLPAAPNPPIAGDRQ